MKEIKCPYDLNQFLLGEPIFENPFPEEECKMRKFYGDCYHCFSTSIASRDHQLKDAIEVEQPKTGHWILDETDNSITCNRCGCLIWANDILRGEAYYCPNCGAKMEVEE